ncbi:B3 domain-containing protein [Asimina triloba]
MSAYSFLLSAYEQSVYCDTFHSKESGWRECKSCGKQLHCGCIASKSSLELLDSGGVECINCAKNAELSSIPSGVPKESNQQSTYKAINLPAKSITDEKMNEHGALTLDNMCERRSTSTDTKTDDEIVDKIKPMKLVKSIEDNMQRDFLDESLESIKREQPMLHLGEVGSTSFSNANQAATLGSSREDNKGTVADKEMYESLAHACLSITLGTSNTSHVPEACYTSGMSNPSMPLRGLVAEGRETSKFLSPFQQGQRSRHLLPKPPRMSPNAVSESSKDMVSQIRVARPPGEGRGRNQLLPRYWPRITDQELQQISGDSNSTIVPLFEKVLSASDAGRIGRLVLPKACAEPEGLPLKIQDAKGKDWVFQFRFWPNNNSRIY